MLSIGVSRAVNARPSAGEVGEPAAVQLGFDDHGLRKLDAHSFNPHNDSRMRTLHVAARWRVSKSEVLRRVIEAVAEDKRPNEYVDFIDVRAISDRYMAIPSRQINRSGDPLESGSTAELIH